MKKLSPNLEKQHQMYFCCRLNKKGNKLIIESLHKKLIFSGKQDLTGTFLLYPLNSNGVFHGQVG